MLRTLVDLYMNYPKIVFLDVETTGLNPLTDNIIELAMIATELDANDNIKVTASMDEFVQVPRGKAIPDVVTHLTGIDMATLVQKGITEIKASKAVSIYFNASITKTLFVSYNAQFDASFILEMLKRYGRESSFDNVDFLDALTLYKDRRAYPHKLLNAIEEYGLSDKVNNSHRAVDDTEALLEVFKAMAHERDDVGEYVNIFGFNPNYGAPSYKIDKITYVPQGFIHCMLPEEATLPRRLHMED